jgi:hypothetical protein
VSEGVDVLAKPIATACIKELERIIEDHPKKVWQPIGERSSAFRRICQRSGVRHYWDLLELAAMVAFGPDGAFSLDTPEQRDRLAVFMGLARLQVPPHPDASIRVAAEVWSFLSRASFVGAANPVRLCHWWRDVGVAMYPTMRIGVRILLGYASGNAALERGFGTCRSVLSPHRKKNKLGSVYLKLNAMPAAATARLSW